jgi:hypothetical protein
MLLSVQNAIAPVGPPVAEWAAAATSTDRPAIWLVVIVATDAVSAAAKVEGSVVQALFDVVGDREVGWSAHDWKAVRELV